jgi:hypothetical protein
VECRCCCISPCELASAVHAHHCTPQILQQLQCISAISTARGTAFKGQGLANHVIPGSARRMRCQADHYHGRGWRGRLGGLHDRERDTCTLNTLDRVEGRRLTISSCLTRGMQDIRVCQSPQDPTVSRQVLCCSGQRMGSLMLLQSATNRTLPPHTRMVWLKTHTREISRFSNAWFKTQGC